MTRTSRQFIEDTIAALPEPGADPISRLRHALAASEDRPDEEMAITATWGVYGDGVKTGVTYGDLRAILTMIS